VREIKLSHHHRRVIEITNSDSESNFQPKSNEDAISVCFQEAIKKLEEVNADANKKKTKIVQDLAKSLEKRFPQTE